MHSEVNGYLEELAALEFSRRFGEIESSIDLGKVLSISTKTLKPQNCHGEIWEHYSIPAYDANRRPVFELADGIKSNKYVIDASCILISKLNPSIRRIWMPACSSKQAVCSTEFIVYKPKNPVHKAFYYAAIGAPAFRDFLLAHVTGSTGSRQRTEPKATLTYPIPNPGLEAVEDFCAFANPLYEQIKVNERNSTQLEELRDTLLPKLMTGEIDVSKVDFTQLNSHLAETLRQFGCHIPAIQKRGGPHFCEAPRVPGYRVIRPTSTAPLLPKNRCEQSFAFGLFLSVGTLGSCCHLTRLLAASTAHDLV